MILRIRKSRTSKAVSLFLLFSWATELVFPTFALALTNGPTQPETQSFEPVGTTQMVDPFTGDFVYNIPLMDVDGYPLNISYHSGIGMDQEASWVGLGWNINVGAINRGMRGIPDDFMGDEDAIKKEYNIKENMTVGGNIAIGDIEIFGGNIFNVDLGLKFGIFYNNYNGIGHEIGINPTIAIGDKNKSPLTMGLGLTANTQQGVDLTPTVGLSGHCEKKDKTNAVFGRISATTSINSRAGLKQLTFGASAGVASGSTRGKSFEHGGSYTLPVGHITYVPHIAMPMTNVSGQFDFGLGPEVKWLTGKVRLGGYASSQFLLSNERTLPAYGFLYAHEGQNENSALHDFNREKDGSFTKTTPSLPLTNFTYDTYGVSGQGVGGVYRPYRNDKGWVYDAETISKSVGINAGGDIAGGDVVKGGANIGANFNESKSGPWTSNHSSSAQQTLRFEGYDYEDPTYEPYYFKAAGEMTSMDDTYFNSIGKDDAVRIDISNQGSAKNGFQRKLEDGTEEWMPMDGHKRMGRVKRNQAISILTAEEAEQAGLETKIKSYAKFTDPSNGSVSITEIPRTGGVRKKHHISEITVYRPDGARYVYGIAAYNTKQVESTFNIDERTADCSTGLVPYTNEDSKDNNKGLDHYYSKTVIPPYAHSYLLTAVLSADYVDRTLDGPTDDDLGTYTKFNYTRQNDDTEPNSFKWRIPFQQDSANYDQGLKVKVDNGPEIGGEKGDGKGSYVYGEKEIWYMNSIETKTQLAEFYTSERNDAAGAADKNGGVGAARSMKLDKISLYSKCERREKGANAIPIQEVHFDYTYELCKNIPNASSSGTGKLTLKKLWFTYGKSLKGAMSTYRFSYAKDLNPEYNPDYNSKAYDRWGNYKPVEGGNTCESADYPYVDQYALAQRSTKADVYASAWNLTKIELPSGGVMNIEYESDDYGFVQNKRAMQMVNVAGLHYEPIVNSSALTDPSALYNSGVNNYILLDLPDKVHSKEEFERKYLKDFDGKSMENIYFKFLVDVIGDPPLFLKDDSRQWEYVTGYAELIPDEFGIADEDPVTHESSRAWVAVKKVAYSDMTRDNNTSTHPISRASWQMVRLNLGEKVSPANGSLKDQANPVTILKNVVGAIQDIKMLAEGYNGVLSDRGFGRVAGIGGHKSMVRLYNPQYKKLGGGSRVKKLLISDRWSAMAGAPHQDEEYGQEYLYTKILEGSVTDDLPEGIEISSGVAEYEPIIGNEENPLRQPVAHNIENCLAPDDRFYAETPFGESFYPGPSVGYSQVRVKSLNKEGQKTNTGYVQHEFYTAKDFPVITERTKIERQASSPQIVKKILKLGVKDFMAASQGFVIKLNNMHGQKKAVKTYAEGQASPLFSEEYFYRTREGHPDQLDNLVSVIKKDGTISDMVVGKEVDFVADMRENSSISSSGHLKINADASLFPFPPIPLPIPSIWPSVSHEETKFNSAVVTKTLTNYGILNKVVVYDMSSRIQTENIAYDSETGEVLLTKTQNNFDDPVYDLNYPSHWAYDRMGMAYKNLGLMVNGVNISDGVVLFSNPDFASFFVPGDEVLATIRHLSEIGPPNPPIYDRWWVNKVKKDRIVLMDENGRSEDIDDSNVTLTVVRSGRRNMQAVSVGSIQLKTNPIVADGGIKKLKFTSMENPANVINGSFLEFSDDWKEYCECEFYNGKWVDNHDNEIFTPGVDHQEHEFRPATNLYLSGALGIWRVKRNHALLADRKFSFDNRNTDIRNDGTYTNFISFWNPLNGKDWFRYLGVWTWKSEITKFSPFGFELENKDALGRFSSSIYGYSNTLPVGISTNAKYREIAVDNFEDYNCTNCEKDHWSFKAHLEHLRNELSHSGKVCIQVPQRSKLGIRKSITCEPPPPPQ